MVEQQNAMSLFWPDWILTITSESPITHRTTWHQEVYKYSIPRQAQSELKFRPRIYVNIKAGISITNHILKTMRSVPDNYSHSRTEKRINVNGRVQAGKLSICLKMPDCPRSSCSYKGLGLPCLPVPSPGLNAKAKWMSWNYSLASLLVPGTSEHDACSGSLSRCFHHARSCGKISP